MQRRVGVRTVRIKATRLGDDEVAAKMRRRRGKTKRKGEYKSVAAKDCGENGKDIGATVW